MQKFNIGGTFHRNELLPFEKDGFKGKFSGRLVAGEGFMIITNLTTQQTATFVYLGDSQWQCIHKK